MEITRNYQSKMLGTIIKYYQSILEYTLTIDRQPSIVAKHTRVETNNEQNPKVRRTAGICEYYLNHKGVINGKSK